MKTKGEMTQKEFYKFIAVFLCIVGAMVTACFNVAEWGWFLFIAFILL